MKISDLSPELRRRVNKVANQGKRSPGMTAAEVSQHALAVAAMLRDHRGLKPSDAQRVLRKAMTII